MRTNWHLFSVVFACLSVVINAQGRQLDYVGGDMSVLHRIELVPGRSFQDTNGTAVDPIKQMAARGFDAIRVFVSSDMPLANPTGFPDNSGDINWREANYALDFGGITEQVNLALRARASGMKVILTLHMGQGYGPDSWGEYIPTNWLNLTYTQTLAQLDMETRRQLTAFLDAGVQPDIIIVENEADSGMLYQYVDGSGKMAIRDNPATDVFSNVATGIYSIWPKCAGYFKRVILSAKAVITEKGGDTAYTRFSVHTTTNPYRVSSTYDRIFDQPDINETDYVVNGVDQGVVSIIPADIRNTRLKDLVDIMGASVYPPAPTSGSAADIAISLAQFTNDWGYVGSKIISFGKWTSGPYIGQYRKQGLVVEYALGSVTEAVRIAAVKEFLNVILNSYPWVIGTLWWEPEYANNNWYGGTAELYSGVGWNATTLTVPVFKETPSLAVWGSYGFRIFPSLVHRYSFNETSGTIANDSVGGVAWKGTLPNGGTFGGGKLTLAAVSSQFVNLPANILSNYTAVTIEAWVTFPSAIPWNTFLFGFGNTNGLEGNSYIFCAPQGGRTAITITNYSGEQSATSGFDFSFQTNLHIVAVFNPPKGCLELYTNGVLAAICGGITTPLNAVSNVFSYIGRSLYSSDTYFNFSVDEFRIYNGAMQAADIAATQIIGPDVLLATNVALSASSSGGRLTMTWPVASSGFTLESSSTLGSGTVWTPALIPPTVVGVNNMVNIDSTNRTMFFRLRR
jgi:hypothetical protein